jgi:Uma2 family endonuclease
MPPSSPYFNGANASPLLGARLVWVVDPERRVARVYRQDGTEDIISDDGALLGEDVLPGFSCTLETVI